MAKEQEKTEAKKKVEEKELRCPFSSKDLACEDCRLFQVYSGGGGNRVCPFMRML